MFDTMKFRKEAEELGLSLPNSSSKDHNKVFMLDLNTVGTIYVPGHPEKVLALVKLARSYEKSEAFGQHVAMLNLTAVREELEEPYTQWHRPQYANFDRPGVTYFVTLQKWLLENKSPYVPES